MWVSATDLTIQSGLIVQPILGMQNSVTDNQRGPTRLVLSSGAVQTQAPLRRAQPTAPTLPAISRPKKLCPGCKQIVRADRMKDHRQKCSKLKRARARTRSGNAKGQAFGKLRAKSRKTSTAPKVRPVTVVASPLLECEICGWRVRKDCMERHLKHSCPGLHPSQNSSNSDSIFNGKFLGVPMGKLSFRLLPPGTWDLKQVIDYYEREAHHWRKGRAIQVHRIEALKTLKPSKCSVGTMGFMGYILFEFEWSNSVVLECPLDGNATYVLLGDWSRMIGMNKAQLRTNFVGHFTKAVHKRRWLARVKAALQGRAFALDV